MFGERGNDRWKGALLIAACILALTTFRAGPLGLRLAVNQQGVSFQMTAIFVKVAFDFGQDRPKSNSGGLFR